MLQFIRKIGDDIKITVLDDKHSQVRIGIEAPDDIEIWRDEIYKKILAEDQTRNKGI